MKAQSETDWISEYNVHGIASKPFSRRVPETLSVSCPAPSFLTPRCRRLPHEDTCDSPAAGFVSGWGSTLRQHATQAGNASGSIPQGQLSTKDWLLGTGVSIPQLPPSLGENAEVAFCTGWIIRPVLASCLPISPAHSPNMLPGVTSPKNPSCSHPSLRAPCWGSLTESTWGCSVSLPLPRNRLPMVTRSSPHPSQVTVTVKLSLGVGKKPKVIFFLDH